VQTFEREEASMRRWFGMVAAVGFLAVAGAQAGAAESSTARVVTFGDTATNGEAPVILRGSAVAPQAALAVTPSGQRYQVAAGRRLWFFDPVTKDIRSCINQQTSTVGVRIVRCYRGSLGGYRRTFGPTFQP
jgi:hypothetical protein